MHAYLLLLGISTDSTGVLDASNLRLKKLAVNVYLRGPENGDTLEVMAPSGDKIHITLDEATAVKGLAKVKPTADMPRPGANPTKTKANRMPKRPK
jgi:hypothetical protein